MKKLNRIKGGWILGVLVCLFGCATAEDVRILDREIRRLDSQLIQTQNQNQKEREAIRNDLSALRTDISNENQKLKADLLLRFESLQSETQTLSTGVEEYKEFLKRPPKEIERLKEEVEARLKIFEEKGKTHEERLKGIEDRVKGIDTKISSKPAEGEKPLPQKETAPEWKGLSAGAGDLYREAYETFQKGDLGEARKKFEAFLKKYPHTELSDNAQFWIGETYFLKKDYEKAILEYEKTIVKYPEGDKIPSALLKQGFAFLELGDKTNARNLLKRVVDRYPQTEQAEIARKKLESIK